MFNNYNLSMSVNKREAVVFQCGEGFASFLEKHDVLEKYHNNYTGFRPALRQHVNDSKYIC